MYHENYILTVSIPLCLSAVTLHVIGIYTLQTMKDSNIVQKCFLTQISLSEILLTLLNFTTMTSHAFRKHVQYKMFLDILTKSFAIPLYAGLFLLTAERFLQVYYHLNYRNSWFDQNKKKLCIIAWILAFLTAVIMIVVHQAAYRHCNHVVISISLSLLGTIILLVEFFMTYGYLFAKLYKLEPNERKRNHCITIRRKFLVPLLTIIMLLVFSAVPDLIRVITYCVYKHDVPLITSLYVIHFICDGIIYLFFQPSLRRKVAVLFRGHMNENTLQSTRRGISTLKKSKTYVIHV